jgi:alpha,alpha-trehalase
MPSLPYQAVILDLDGVITQTAHLHARSWQGMFDQYLQQHSTAGQKSLAPFDIDTDYRTYVDGKPRYDGVRSFLESRDIHLPQGTPDDSPDKETICGLGNRKNEIFLELIEAEGVDVYEDTVEKIHQWRSQGLKTAVVSSSRNCKPILENAGLLHLFDTKVDGVDSAQLDLEGKPAPDIFLEAADELGVKPQQAVAIEDAISGVKAGRAGNFGLVVGVDRQGNQRENLLAHGADRVVANLDELNLAMETTPVNGLEHMDEIRQRLNGHDLALFVDYDGTLTPIVAQPEDARLGEGMRSHLKALSRHCTVAIVSGRDRADVQHIVGLENLYYAGSHGFDIAGPGDLHMQQPEAQESLPELDQAENQLRQKLTEMQGVKVERKRFAIAIHYRNAQVATETIESAVNEVQGKFPSLRKKSGKKIFELQPDVDWDKGRAICWLMDKLDLTPPQVVPMYLGDDTTDEDAFCALADIGITLRVGDQATDTQAQYLLPDTDAVEEFFQALLQHLTAFTSNHG